jgi:hypothetical protein
MFFVCLYNNKSGKYLLPDISENSVPEFARSLPDISCSSSNIRMLLDAEVVLSCSFFQEKPGGSVVERWHNN